MYNLESLLKDIAKKRERVKDADSSQLDYHEVWNTFVRYLKSCLEQKRGLTLGSLCKVGWQVEKPYNSLKTQKPTYRPVFQLTEQFCRTYCNQEALRKLTQGGGHNGISEMCPFEDFNFSKAAIKFSNQLTKGQVFSGLRSIVQQLGEVISEGREVDIEFGDVGRLACRDKEPRFHFGAGVYEGEGEEAPLPLAEDDDYPRSGASYRK